MSLKIHTWHITELHIIKWQLYIFYCVNPRLIFQHQRTNSGLSWSCWGSHKWYGPEMWDNCKVRQRLLLRIQRSLPLSVVRIKKQVVSKKAQHNGHPSLYQNFNANVPTLQKGCRSGHKCGRDKGRLLWRTFRHRLLYFLMPSLENSISWWKALLCRRLS